MRDFNNQIKGTKITATTFYKKKKKKVWDKWFSKQKLGQTIDLTVLKCAPWI